MNGCRRCAANGLDEVVHADENSILMIFRDLSNVLNEERREHVASVGLGVLCELVERNLFILYIFTQRRALV